MSGESFELTGERTRPWLGPALDAIENKRFMMAFVIIASEATGEDAAAIDEWIGTVVRRMFEHAPDSETRDLCAHAWLAEHDLFAMPKAELEAREDEIKRLRAELEGTRGLVESLRERAHAARRATQPAPVDERTLLAEARDRDERLRRFIGEPPTSFSRPAPTMIPGPGTKGSR